MYDRDSLLAAVDLDRLADELLGPRTGPPTTPGWPCPDTAHPADRRHEPDVATFATRRGDRRWHCHTCGAGGTAIDLVTKRHGVGVRRALELLDAWLARARAAAPGPASGTAGPAAADALVRTGVDAWVSRAEALLWQPYGEQVRTWLTVTRRIPPDVLRTNRIGATAVTPDHVLPTRRAVDGNRSPSLAAVLPILSKGQAIHAQLRLVTPAAGKPRYLNPTPAPSGRPHLALYRPARRLHTEIVVTEGILDALSANAAGYRAAALLAPAHANAETALHLSRLRGPLVLALHPDGPGGEAAARLTDHLATHGRHPAWLPALPGDLNDLHAAAHDWRRKLTAHIRQATATAPPDNVPSL